MSDKKLADLQYFEISVDLYIASLSRPWISRESDANSFKEWASSKYNMDYGKAMHLKKVGAGIAKLALDKSILDSLDWEDLKKVVTVAKSHEEVSDWVEIRKNTTKPEFDKKIRERKLEGQKTRRMFLKVDPDQEKVAKIAIQLSKKLNKVDTDAAAIEQIFLDYIAGHSGEFCNTEKNRDLITSKMVSFLERVNV